MNLTKSELTMLEKNQQNTQNGQSLRPKMAPSNARTLLLSSPS